MQSLGMPHTFDNLNQTEDELEASLREAKLQACLAATARPLPIDAGMAGNPLIYGNLKHVEHLEYPMVL